MRAVEFTIASLEAAPELLLEQMRNRSGGIQSVETEEALRELQALVAP